MEKYNLNDVSVFIAVVEGNSFTSAANALDMPKSTVSSRITELEKALEVKLLERTTRTLSLTEAGNLFYASAKRILAEAETGLLAIENLIDKPRGIIKISAPFALSSSILPELIKAFSEQYPDITIELNVENQLINLVQENIDLALRVSHHENESEVAQNICQFHQVVVASDDYIKQYGTPSNEEALLDHDVILCKNAQGVFHPWKDSNEKSLKLSPKMIVNDPVTRIEIIKQGLGISWLPKFLCGDDINNGTLVTLFENSPLHITGLYAVVPSIRANNYKVNLLVNFLKKNIIQFDGIEN